MDEWERLEREATAGRWSARRSLYSGDNLADIGGVCAGMSAENAALVAYLRNRSPQLRAVVEAAQEAVESASLMVSANDGDPKCMAERTRLDAAAEALAAALKALDEVGHG